MLEPLWDAVDRGLCDWLVEEDDALRATLADAAAAGLPAIHVSPTQGKLLHLLVRMRGARRVLEIGTLAGYSAIWMARALPPEGSLMSLEIDPTRAELATRSLRRAGCGACSEVIVGPALDSLDRLIHAGAKPFDFVFIDADKVHCAEYLDRAIALGRSGTAIVIDNVIRSGKVLETDSEDSSVRGVRRVLDAIRDHPGLTATALQTVGSKGYDGFVLALVQ
jgi:predicted O-methyltransferase YrrM